MGSLWLNKLFLGSLPRAPWKVIFCHHFTWDPISLPRVLQLRPAPERVLLLSLVLRFIQNLSWCLSVSQLTPRSFGQYIKLMTTNIQFYLIQWVKQFKHPRAPAPSLAPYPPVPGLPGTPAPVPVFPGTLSPTLGVPGTLFPVPRLPGILFYAPGLPGTLTPVPGLSGTLSCSGLTGPLPHLPGDPGILTPDTGPPSPSLGPSGLLSSVPGLSGPIPWSRASWDPCPYPWAPGTLSLPPRAPWSLDSYSQAPWNLVPVSGSPPSHSLSSCNPLLRHPCSA